MNESEKKKKGLGALDWMILILAAFAVASIVMRYLRTANTSALGKVPLQKYAITFEVKNIRDESASQYMNKDDVFYLSDTGKEFGVLKEQNSKGGTSKNFELLNGEIVARTMEAESTKDQYRVDVKATVESDGRYDADGTFLLGGTRRIGLNKELTIYSKKVTFTVMVTDIQPVKASAGTEAEEGEPE